jgi:hypothetical protein
VLNYNSAAGFCERGNGPSGFIKDGECFEYFLKEDSSTVNGVPIYLANTLTVFPRVEMFSVAIKLKRSLCAVRGR